MRSKSQSRSPSLLHPDQRVPCHHLFQRKTNVSAQNSFSPNDKNILTAYRPPISILFLILQLPSSLQLKTNVSVQNSFPPNDKNILTAYRPPISILFLILQLPSSLQRKTNVFAQISLPKMTLLSKSYNIASSCIAARIKTASTDNSQ